MAIPLVDVKVQYETIKDEINEAIREVLQSQRLILAPKVQELEENIAHYCDVKYGIGVASESDAVLLSLMAIGAGCGDEGYYHTVHLFATAGSISRLGAKPVFVDIDPKTYNIDPLSQIKNQREQEHLNAASSRKRSICSQASS